MKFRAIAAILIANSSVFAETIEFSGYTWNVRKAGKSGPGPNTWEPKNVRIDDKGRLHLKITESDSQWYCAEISTVKKLGFGTYQFWIEGRIDQLNENSVFGLFNYPTHDLGPDATHEIDIEFAQWGKPENDNSSYTVWPAKTGNKCVSKTFQSKLNGSHSTHRFTWTPDQVQYRSQHGHRNDEQETYAQWLFQPELPKDAIAQKPMPLHINLWCFQGRPPTDGKPVELIVTAFKFTTQATPLDHP